MQISSVRKLSVIFILLFVFVQPLTATADGGSVIADDNNVVSGSGSNADPEQSFWTAVNDAGNHPGATADSANSDKTVTQRVKAILDENLPERSDVTVPPEGSVNPQVKTTSAVSGLSSDDGWISANGGKLLSIAIIKSKADAVNSSLATIQQLANGITVYTINKGKEYYLVLSGYDAQQVKDAGRKVAFMVGIVPKAANLMVDMAATLREYTESETTQLGLPLIPTSFNLSTTFDPITVLGPRTSTAGVNVSSNETWQTVNLYNVLTTGKVMVAGSAMTHNGMLCNISTTNNIPINVAQSGSITTSLQTVTSTIEIVPNIISYDEQHPEKSQVRINVQAQLSVITNNVPNAGVSFTTKNITETRIIAADGRPNIVGSFVSDQNLPSYTYIPILNKIPLLNYFFGYSTSSIQRELSILFISARIIPQEQ